MDRILTKEQKASIANNLNSLIAPEKSCICNFPKITIWDELVALPLADAEAGLSGKGNLVIGTQCDNCGRLDFFSAGKFGL